MIVAQITDEEGGRGVGEDTGPCTRAGYDGLPAAGFMWLRRVDQPTDHESMEP